MRIALLTSTALLAWALPVLAEPGDVRVYHCVSTSGEVSYQDQPCPPSSDATLRRLPRPDDPPPAPADLSDLSSDSPTETAAAVNRVEPPPEPPTLWLCVDVEGEERESSDGIPQGRYVPLWVVGRDPYAPAQMFGRVGEPRPLPRVQPADGQPTRVTTRPAQNTLVYVEERCRALPATRICERYSEQLRELQRAMFNSQSSDRAKLEPASKRLKDLLTTHCSGR